MTDTTPSRRAGLRDEIVKALGQIEMVPPVAHRREQADHVLAVLYREWPWLRAEAEDAASVVVPAADRVKAIADAIGPNMLFGLQGAELFGEPGQERIRDWIKWISETVAALPATALPAPADRATVLREAADRIETLMDQAYERALSDHEIGWANGLEDAMRELRRMAAAVPAVGVAAETPPAFGADRDSNNTPKAGPKAEMVHACPPGGSGLTPCCGRTPFELPLTDRISSEAPVTCRPAVEAQPGNDTKTPVVAYRSTGARVLRCLSHYPDNAAFREGDLHPVTSEDLPDGGLCTKCGVDVLIPQQPSTSP